MRKVYILVALLFILSSVYAQRGQKAVMPNLGDRAPSFTLNSTQGEINFPEDFFAKWKIIFSHPADFTPVCTSELLELAYMQNFFKKMNTAIMVLSTDGLNAHIQWVESMESIEYKDMGKVDIKFPLVSDAGYKVSSQYGMIHPNSNSTKAVRAVFIIDPDNIVRSLFIYPHTVGRNMDEIKRTLIALQETDRTALLSPANWSKGDDLLMSSPKTIEESDKLKAKKNPSFYSLAWYMWFVKQ